MAIKNALVIGDNIVTDAEMCRVVSSQGESNASSNFTIRIPNYNGMHKADFNIGDQVEIFSSDSENPLESIFPLTFPFIFGNPTRIFLGILETIDYEGEGSVEEKMVLSGRDYSARLMDTTIQPVVYTDQEISTIIKSIMATEVPDVTTNNVATTSVTLSRKRYSQMNVFDAIKELAQYANYYFYIDTNKDLHFAAKSSVSSGVTAASDSNILTSSFEVEGSEIVNSCFVYGDRQLTAAPTETFTSDGAGSVYGPLVYKPYNTEVTVADTIKKGGLLDANLQAASGVQYLVNFEDSKIIMVSGTNNGANNPASGTSFTVDYQRSVPIVTFNEDPASISTYGRRRKIIIDNSIKDPKQAQTLVANQVQLYANPKKYGTLKLQGVVSLTAGDLLTVNIPTQNISNENFTILEVVYDFNPENNERETVITVKVGQKVYDFLDTMKQALLDIRRLQSDDADSGDVVTRLITGIGSTGPRVSAWSVATKSLGSSFILGNATLAKLGSNLTPQPYLGDSTGPLTVIYSGGETV